MPLPKGPARCHVRPAQPEDAEAIYEAHTAAIRRTLARDYPPEVLAAHAARQSPKKYRARIETGGVLVAVVGGQVVGFAHPLPGKLAALYVHPDFQGRGIGSALLREAERGACAGGGTEVVVNSSLTAVGFYERQGYVREGEGAVELGGVLFRYVAMRKRWPLPA